MQGYQQEAARDYIVQHLDPKLFRGMQNRLADIIDTFIQYDLHFMRLTGVLDEEGCQGENEYDDDEAFEYIYDAWLSDHPGENDEDMKVAELLNAYMDLQCDYLVSQGLADL